MSTSTPPCTKGSMRWASMCMSMGALPRCSPLTITMPANASAKPLSPAAGDQGALLERRHPAVKHKDRPDAMEQQAADSLEEACEVCVGQHLAICAPASFHELVDPDRSICSNRLAPLNGCSIALASGRWLASCVPGG